MEVLVAMDAGQLPPRNPNAPRAPINLALVLDKSGSMSGTKMQLTIAAARQAIAALDGDDFLVIVAFSTEIHTLFAGNPVNRDEINTKLASLDAQGGTDLYGGWTQGAQELARMSDPSRLSRLVLLTDGEANHGIVDPNTICAGLAHYARQGIQTTTLGFGSDYQESLLSQMARSGGGNHGYIESGPRISRFFEEEMTALTKTRGTKVRLKLQPGAGVSARYLARVGLNQAGEANLADLIEGQPLAVLVSLEVSSPPEGSLLTVHLYWRDLENARHREDSLALVLPATSATAWQSLPTHPRVESHLASFTAQILREQAMELLDWDLEGLALNWLRQAAQLPALPEEERKVVHDLCATVERRDHNAGRKKMAMYSHGHGSGHARVSSHYAQEAPLLPVSTHKSKTQTLPLGEGPLLFGSSTGIRPAWPRVKGMLQGHFFGERLVRGSRAPFGEGASLSMATMEFLLNNSFHPRELAAVLRDAPVLHPTTSQQKFRHRFQQGSYDLLDIGSPSAGCAAIRRMCPLLLPHCGAGYLYLEAALATVITHRDNLALTASLGYLALLWKLLQQKSPPGSEFYGQTFVDSIQGLEIGDPYGCQSKHGPFKGWQGTLAQFLPMALAYARSYNWSAQDAMRIWGSGPYLLEVIPSLIYVLELHAHEPGRALEVATADTSEADTLGMLVGAALGAIHGPQPGWFLDDKVEALLDKAEKRWGGL